MFDAASRIAANLSGVRQRMATTAQRSGRSAEDVRLVAVTKYVGTAEIEALLAAGCRDLGEARPQDLWRKAEAFRGRDARWHLIGHLQRNKLSRTLPLVDLLHSADGESLLAAIDAWGRAAPGPVDVLLEVNVSGDVAKHGFSPEEVTPLWPRLASLAGVRIRGLMGMSGREATPDEARRQFVALRILRDALLAAGADAAEFRELSMGMTDDFEIAIEEGATLVRVGSALFEGLENLRG